MFRILIGLCILGSALSNTVFQSGVPMPDGRIIGGENAYIHEHPYQISMRRNGNHRCGGSLITTNKVLTAAHCVVDLESPAGITIVAGSTELSQKPQEIAVSKFIVHEKYRALNSDYDVAICLLNGDFKLNDNVKLIELAEERPENGTPVTVTGWGTLVEGGTASSHLQKVEVNIIDNQKCRSSYSIMLTSRMLCAGVNGGGKDSCQGDSGGPMVHNNKQLGVVSWGIGCASPNYPGVYASIPNLRDWIKDSVVAYSDIGSIDFL